MGISTEGPTPWTKHRISTTFLRVPSYDWVLVSRGEKREFRASPWAGGKLFSVVPPTPVVAYRTRHGPAGGHDSKLMVMEDKWMEMLGAISEESLREEGFKSLAEFRRYWMRREHRRFTPTRQVMVYRVRPWQPGDEEALGAALVRKLYGRQLDELAE